MIIVVRLTANAAEQFPCKRIPLIRCLPVRCMSCRNSLCQLPCLFIHDCRKAVFYQIFRQFSVVSDLLMCDRICNECLLKQAVTAVFLISDNVLNGGLRPGSTRHSGRHFIGNEPVGDFTVIRVMQSFFRMTMTLPSLLLSQTRLSSRFFTCSIVHPFSETISST